MTAFNIKDATKISHSGSYYDSTSLVPYDGNFFDSFLSRKLPPSLRKRRIEDLQLRTEESDPKQHGVPGTTILVVSVYQ